VVILVAATSHPARRPAGAAGRRPMTVPSSGSRPGPQDPGAGPVGDAGALRGLLASSSGHLLSVLPLGTLQPAGPDGSGDHGPADGLIVIAARSACPSRRWPVCCRRPSFLWAAGVPLGIGRSFVGALGSTTGRSSPFGLPSLIVTLSTRASSAVWPCHPRSARQRLSEAFTGGFGVPGPIPALRHLLAGPRAWHRCTGQVGRRPTPPERWCGAVLGRPRRATPIGLFALSGCRAQPV
jgi:hypothetical protein